MENTDSKIDVSEANRQKNVVREEYENTEKWLKAPNGNISNLTEDQWIAVRTPNFKRWFGNWEYDENQKVEVVDISGIDLSSQNIDIKEISQLKDWLNKNLVGKTVINGDSQIPTYFSSKGTRDSLKKRGFGQRNAYSALDKLLENAIYYDFEKNDGRKKHSHIYGQDIYYGALEFNNEIYSVKIKCDINSRSFNSTYKDHKVSEINLTPVSYHKASTSGIKIADYAAHRLNSESSKSYSHIPATNYLTIGQLSGGVKPNFSKVIDGNGEPLVVYHTTESDFDVFDISKARRQSDVQAFYFSSGKSDWREMGKNVVGAFLNIRNITKKPIINRRENNAGIKAREDLEQNGFDGTIMEEEGMETEYAVFNSSQIKSASGNNGNFNLNKESIVSENNLGYTKSSANRNTNQKERTMKKNAKPASRIDPKTYRFQNGMSIDDIALFGNLARDAAIEKIAGGNDAVLRFHHFSDAERKVIDGIKNSPLAPDAKVCMVDNVERYIAASHWNPESRTFSGEPARMVLNWPYEIPSELDKIYMDSYNAKRFTAAVDFSLGLQEDVPSLAVDDYTVSKRQVKESGEARDKIISEVLSGEKSGMYTAFKKFSEHGVWDIRNEKVELSGGTITDTGWKQLRAAMEIYRNKRFETTRYVFIDRKTGVVKDQLALSSHLPNVSVVSEYNGKTLMQVITRAKETDCVVAMAHNHPSGNVEQSIDDMKTTAEIEKFFRSNGGEQLFAGHIILDHENFNLYTPDKGWGKKDIEKPRKDRLEKENKAGWENKYIGSTEALKNVALGDVARAINGSQNYSDDFVPVAFADTQLKMSGVQFFHKSFFEKSPDFIKKELELAGRQAGATRAFPVFTEHYLRKLDPVQKIELDKKLRSCIFRNAFCDACVGKEVVSEKYGIEPGNAYFSSVSAEKIVPEVHATFNTEKHKTDESLFQKMTEADLPLRKVAANEEKYKRLENESYWKDKKQMEKISASMKSAAKDFMDLNATPITEIPFTKENYNKLFPRAIIQTPVETVKLGEHQFEKLDAKGRGRFLLASYQTLAIPDIVIDEEKEEKHSHNYIKSFVFDEKTKAIQDIVVNIDGKNISISAHPREINNVLNKIKTPDQLVFAAAEVGRMIEQRVQNELSIVNPTRAGRLSTISVPLNKEYSMENALSTINEAVANAVLAENGSEYHKSNEKELGQAETVEKMTEADLPLGKVAEKAEEFKQLENESYWKDKFINENAGAFKALDDYLNNGTKPKNDEFVFKQVPEILKTANVSENEIVIKTSVINKAKNEHHLSEQEIKDSIKNIASPVLIFDSDKNTTENKKKSFLSLTDTFAENGKPVAFSLNLDSEYEKNRSILNVNQITSIHDRTLIAKNGTDLIQKWTENGLCRYVDDKKISDWQLAAGVQFPLAVLQSDKNNIKTFSDFVNQHSIPREVQEYKQKYPESSLDIPEDTRTGLENVFSQIDDYIDKGIVPEERRFTLPETPLYLKELGSNETAISLPVSVIKKAKETHGLSNAEIKNSLLRLYDPVAVFDTDKTKSENKLDSKLVLTDEFSKTKPVALAINTNTQIQVQESGHRKFTEVQDIRSIHDRTLTAKNGTDLIKQWTENGLCRYVDDKKISEWSTVARVYFPIEALQSDKNTVLTKSKVVNRYNIVSENIDSGIEAVLPNGTIHDDGIDTQATEADVNARNIEPSEDFTFLDENEITQEELEEAQNEVPMDTVEVIKENEPVFEENAVDLSEVAEAQAKTESAEAKKFAENKAINDIVSEKLYNEKKAEYEKEAQARRSKEDIENAKYVQSLKDEIAQLKLANEKLSERVKNLESQKKKLMKEKIEEPEQEANTDKNQNEKEKNHKEKENPAVQKVQQTLPPSIAELSQKIKTLQKENDDFKKYNSSLKKENEQIKKANKWYKDAMYKSAKVKVNGVVRECKEGLVQGFKNAVSALDKVRKDSIHLAVENKTLKTMAAGSLQAETFVER